MSELGITERASPNWDERRLPISMIVLHYTGNADAAACIDRFCAKGGGSAPHYVVAADGGVTRLVDEWRRAWHAGAGHWRDVTDIDSAAIGINLVHPGHAAIPAPYPRAQIEATCALIDDVKRRFGITRGNIVGHSDVAPARSRSPGELFPWDALARLRLALPRPTKGLMDPHWSEAGFLLALERFGYDVSNPMAAIMAFQRRFRPEMIDGEMDAECRMILLALLLPKPTGDD